MRNFFRFGIIAKGIVYFLIGVLAIIAAISYGGQQSGSKGVLKFLEDQPFGNVLVGLIGVGLLAYAAWKWYQAISNLGGNNNSKKEEAKEKGRQAGYVASGIFHVLLSFYAFSLVIGSSSSNSDGSKKKEWIAKILEQSWGEWIIGAAAIAFMGFAVYQIYKGVSAKFMDQVEGLSANERKIYKRSGQIGLPARGVIFGIIGYFLLQVALNSNAGNVKGSGGALETLQEQGIWWAVAVAVGLAAYGVFMFIKGRYKSF